MTVSKTTRKNYKYQAYDFLKEKLINGYYPAGSILNETSLAENLNISRTPVREALSLLEIEGYIEIVPKKGILVKDITLSDVTQVFQARIEIEPIALRLAFPNLPLEELIKMKNSFLSEEIDYEENYKKDMEMHLYLLSHCGNRYIVDMLTNVLEKNTRIIVKTSQTKCNVDESVQQHVQILDYLIDQNIDEAVQALREHLIHCRRAAIDYFHIY